MSASSSSRAALLARLAANDWDLLVIGGGISGAGVLREAARLGWKALLIEQRDFAFGTSSRSSKLVHGGLRYLKEGQLRTTWHSVRERQRLMREAPELIESQSFLFADCQGRKPGRHLFEFGLRVYDLMAGTSSHRYVNAGNVAALAPGLRPPALKGAMSYLDAKTDDARLVLRVLQEARQDGALALNYLAARTPVLENGRVVGMQLEDLESGRSHTVRARAVVNATGVWADRLRGKLDRPPLLRPLRGSHLVIPAWRLPVAQAISLMHPQDGRPVFFYPWEGSTLIGTTDIDHVGDLDREASISPAEVDYLLAAVNDQFPGLSLGRADIAACYAGVRPVVSDGAKAPSASGRDHVVLDEQGMVTVTGGKLTTFRLMALDALAAVQRQWSQQTLPGTASAFPPYRLSDGPVFRPATSLPASLAPAVARRLAARFGAQAADVLNDANASELCFIPGTETLWLELRHAARHEQVVHLDDLLLRRVRLGILLPDGGLAHAERIRSLCQTQLGWSDAQWQQELARYRSIITSHYSLPANP
ncbi:glycerol-3-phosphate dehydrogenase/oxidase [Chitinimonas sp.]|uniref:glycerol-3-phosphate dehydrogenase/oxidase n=1 Tax=Chitinimonas sp. TaxID=1934313 RepID=UPI0035B02D06